MPENVKRMFKIAKKLRSILTNPILNILQIALRIYFLKQETLKVLVVSFRELEAEYMILKVISVLLLLYA